MQLKKNERENENSILCQLNGIPYGALLKVLWLDAATVKNADLRKLPLRNDYVETRRSTVGTYVCLQKGQKQKVWHIVLEMDNMDDSGSTIRSIPVCLIYEVIAPSLKSPESINKGIELMIRHHRREKRVLHLKGGAVKILD